MEIYFDNAATTQVIPAVSDAVVRAMTEQYGNPSSLHHKGYEAEMAARESLESIASLLKVQRGELLVTSGGTESDNMALIGGARAHQREGNHLITTAIEHPAILSTMKYLESQGFRVTYLPVDGQGVVRGEDLRAALDEETILVSIMYVNNEIGSVQPIAELSRIVKAYNPKILFHCDAVQAFGKYPIRPAAEGIDLMSVSAHKFHGPKGVGFLYIRDKVRVLPLLYGGGQQKDMRSGTENVPGIAGMAEAARFCYEDMENRRRRLYEIKEYLAEGILDLGDTCIHGPRGEAGAPHVLSAGFAGVRSEVLLHALEERGIYVSSGSACASNHPAVSDTLKAIGCDKKWLDSTIRFSFSDLNTMEEAGECLRALKELVPALRRFQRR